MRKLLCLLEIGAENLRCVLSRTNSKIALLVLFILGLLGGACCGVSYILIALGSFLACLLFKSIRQDIQNEKKYMNCIKGGKCA